MFWRPSAINQLHLHGIFYQCHMLFISIFDTFVCIIFDWKRKKKRLKMICSFMHVNWNCWHCSLSERFYFRSAFAFWLTANILLCSVIWYGAACFTLTGVCMVLAAVIYHYLCPHSNIRMPCSDGALVLTYGWCFWSTFVFGEFWLLISCTFRH